MKGKMITITLCSIMICFLFNSCATTSSNKKVWTRTNFSEDEFRDDNAHCYMLGRQIGAASAAAGGYQSVIGSAIAEGMTSRDEYHNCMKMKGYYLIDK